MSGGKDGGRVPVSKTYKLFVGGGFVRSESGRSFKVEDGSGAFVANLSRASRKDLRDAVKAARAAQLGWAGRSAFNRSQILFRVAEMLEDRRASFEDGLVRLTGLSAADAKAELETAVDRAFWFAGWADKYSQVLGGINPVATPFFNFTLPEPTGVVVALASQHSPLVGLVSAICPVILSGNTVVVVSDEAGPTIAIDLAEVLATSDVPGGVVNILTGQRDELLPHAASHMDVNAMACFGASPGQAKAIQQAAADNVKRVALLPDPDTAAWRGEATQDLYWIDRFVEWKTAWHPIGV